MTLPTHIRTWTARALLAFVFVTIGFAVGRETAPQAPAAANPRRQAGGEKVVVYSAHTTFRCWDCNQIEAMTKELLDSEFAEAKASGRLEHRSVDYMKDAAFAERYDIATSTVVVAVFEGGEAVEFERLDEVWTKIRDREAFMAYVMRAVESGLAKLSEDAEK